VPCTTIITFLTSEMQRLIKINFVNVFEKRNSSYLFDSNLPHRMMSMGTYERTNCVSVC
jgi:hypothetical protein